MSDFVDLDAAEPTEGRLVPIKSRWGRTRQMPCRDSQHGPVVSDSRLMARRRPTALRWMGHQPSDEFTAMLSLNKARDWQGFVAAVDRVAVPGQFMVYADARGRVGSAIAARLPQRRSDQALPGPTRATGDLGHWRATASARSLPLCVDPVDGVVASANEKPLDCPVTVSHFWPPRDRHRRMTESLTRRGKVDVAQVMAMQRDVFSEASRDFRDMLAPQLAALRLGARGEVLAMLDAIGRWDAHYDETSEGAAAFECLLYHFACALHGPDLSAYWATWDPLSLLRREAEAMGEQDFRRALAEAMGPAACAWRKHRRWGDMHRLMLGHALSFLPLVGRLFRFADLPVGGANQTLMKSAHGLAGGRHAAKFGAQARQVCDMSDPDANWFVLLGGQDGWMGSDTFLDQLDLWRKGEYVRMPLSPEAVADCYPLRTDLVPDRRR